MRKKKQITGLPESVLQKAVVAHFLDLEKKVGGFTFFSVVGGSVRVPPHIGKRLKESGCRAGVSDLVFILSGGKSVFIELKSMTGSLQPPQRKWDAKLRKLNTPSYCLKAATTGEIIALIYEILEDEGLFLFNNATRGDDDDD